MLGLRRDSRRRALSRLRVRCLGLPDALDSRERTPEPAASTPPVRATRTTNLAARQDRGDRRGPRRCWSVALASDPSDERFLRAFPPRQGRIPLFAYKTVIRRRCPGALHTKRHIDRHPIFGRFVLFLGVAWRYLLRHWSCRRHGNRTDDRLCGTGSTAIFQGATTSGCGANQEPSFSGASTADDDPPGGMSTHQGSPRQRPAAPIGLPSDRLSALRTRHRV